MRRKGERPLPIHLDNWHKGHPVAHVIETGSHWFQAWLTQKNTPYVRLTALTGIPSHRFTAISGGDVVSRAEIDALACAWSISARDLIASIAGRSENCRLAGCERLIFQPSEMRGAHKFAGQLSPR